jgi:hypothetical protein
MAKVNVDCPECGDRQQFEEAHLGSEIEVPDSFRVRTC